MSLSIQIISDIHLEYYKRIDEVPVIYKHAEFLGIIGDCGNPYTQLYWDFITLQSKTYDKVFLILGNHDYYSKINSIDQTIHHVRNLCSKFNNVILLEKNIYYLNDDTAIIGCTLWSNINHYASNYITDFRSILTSPKYTKHANSNDIKLIPNYINKNTYNQYHNIDVEFLTTKITQLTQENKKIVILTHFVPSFALMGKYKDSKINSAFCSDLEYLIKKPVVAWGFGHTHSNVDMYINDVRCVSNALGYKDEKDVGYKNKVVIKI